MRSEICMFCKNLAGSEEHVFLSSLGGRVITRRATCLECNNSFANEETGKVDDALAEALIQIRNALKIWTGRGKPPPMIYRAGTMDDGVEFDLAPGFVPLVRAAQIPDQLVQGQVIVASNIKDAKRLKSIFEKRKWPISTDQAVLVTKKVPNVHLRTSFDGNKVWRCVAKTAVVGCVVLYGNDQAKAVISPELLMSIRHGAPHIAQFAGWDYINNWPQVTSLTPHKKTPNAIQSGFEHSLVITDVQDRLVAYVELFGGWRFSVNLGPKSGLQLRGIVLNPRSSKPARFEIKAAAPDLYLPRTEQSFKTEHQKVWTEVKTAANKVMECWSIESKAQYAQDLSDELIRAVKVAGDNEAQRQKVIDDFAAKLVLVECGEVWESDLGTLLDEDA
jgi:hypothetical protein